MLDGNSRANDEEEIASQEVSYFCFFYFFPLKEMAKFVESYCGRMEFLGSSVFSWKIENFFKKKLYKEAINTWNKGSCKKQKKNRVLKNEIVMVAKFLEYRRVLK